MIAPITVLEICLRLGLAFLAGFAVGWERESHGRPAGLRTNILACVAAAVAMIVSEVLFLKSAAATPTGSVRADPARLGAGILTGIGFLGASTILRHDSFVRGVTTAATLWLVTVLGLAFGGGFYTVGLLGSAVGLVSLFALPYFEAHVESDWYATLTVSATLNAFTEDELRKRIESFGVRVLSMKIDYDLEQQQRTLTPELKLKRGERFEVPSKIVASLGQWTGVQRVRWG